MNQKREISVFVASPGDVGEERGHVTNVVHRLNDTLAPELGIYISVKKWENLPPAAGAPQDIIDASVQPYDIFLGIMAHRFGTPTGDYESGVQHEFEAAYDAWKRAGTPELMFYFRDSHFSPSTADEAEQFSRVLRFRENLSDKILRKHYGEPSQFADLLRDDLEKTVVRLAQKPDRLTAEDTVNDTQSDHATRVVVEDMQESWSESLVSSSFEPGRHPGEHQFHMARIQTTSGYVRNNKGEIELQQNFVTVIKDPIRPFDIQIGETRALRRGGDATAVPDLENLDLGNVKSMYPFFQVDGYKWIRMVLAELTSDPKILDYIHANDPDPQVRAIAARNPSARGELQRVDCLFCQDEFRQKRLLPSGSERTLMCANDFPYGPYFHYIAFPHRPIHAWQDIELADLEDLNLTIWKFLRRARKSDKWLPAAGVFVGLNSSIRHLVMGTRTRTSAGASITHIHKQIWGMAPGSVNLGDHLNGLCQRHKGPVGYLQAYYEFLKQEGMVIFEDDNVVLYVPFGQISVHELQVMVKHPGKTDFLSLSEADVRSLSKAEAIAVRLLDALGIHSFNEVVLNLPFDSNSQDFQIVMCFLTREVDLAVSELNQLFVVDKFPQYTKRLVMQCKDMIIRDVLT